MKKALVIILQYVIFLGLGIAIVIYMLRHTDMVKMKVALTTINYWLLIPIFFVGFLSHFFRALRWKLLLEHLKIHPSTLNITFAVLVGYITNLLVPRAGEVAKCTVLAKYEKMPTDKMIGTILAERAWDIVCLLMAFAIAFITQGSVMAAYAHEHLFTNMTSKRNALIITLLVIAAIVFSLVFVYRRNKESKVGIFIKGMGHGVQAIIHMRKRWQFMGYTFLIWFMYFMQIFIGIKCMPATAALGPLPAFIVLVFGSIGMIATQGGIGAYPLVVGQILLVYHIDEGFGQAFGWMAWAVQTGIIIILGLASFILLPIVNRKRHAQTGLDTAQGAGPGDTGTPV